MKTTSFEFDFTIISNLWPWSERRNFWAGLLFAFRVVIVTPAQIRSFSFPLIIIHVTKSMSKLWNCLLNRRRIKLATQSSASSLPLDIESLSWFTNTQRNMDLNSNPCYTNTRDSTKVWSFTCSFICSLQDVVDEFMWIWQGYGEKEDIISRVNLSIALLSNGNFLSSVKSFSSPPWTETLLKLNS